MTPIPVLFFCLLLPAAPGDKIHLKNGKVLEGEVELRKPKFVRARIAGRVRKIPRSRISKITDENGHIRWVDAYRLDTAHYAVRTNVGRKRAGEMIDRLEKFYTWFQKEFRKDFKPHKVKRMGVYIFRTRAEYKKVWHAETHQQRDPPTGFYYSGTETLYIVDKKPLAVDLAKNALFHEGGHQLLHLACSLSPVRPGQPRHWINEALPCFFEALEPKQGGMQIGIDPHRIVRICSMIRRGRHMPLDRFDMGTRANFGIDQYCQAYALAYFFMTAEKGKYRKPFLTYCRDVWLTRVRPFTFAKHFGKEIGELEDEWKRFTLGLRRQALSRTRTRR